VRLRPDSPSIYLPDSGQIDLNAIGVEAGQANNSQTALNDAAVRDMIGKAANAQNAMSEYYGASSSDAVDSYVFGLDWSMALTNQPSSYIPMSNRLSGNPLGYPHRWPLATADNQPHALIAPYRPVVINPNEINAVFPSWCTNSYGRQNGSVPNQAGGNNGSLGNPNTLRGVSPLQRVKPGTHTYNGSWSLSNSGHDGSPYSIEVNLLEYETMTPGSDGFASAGGGYRRQQLASGSGQVGGSRNANFSTPITTIYDWLYLEMKCTTQHNRGTDSRCQVNSIS
jgi:hypothetical protein